MSNQKSVLIYTEYWSSRGGGEKYLLTIVETLLQAGYDVTIVTQTASFNKDAVSQYFKVNIDGAKIEFVAGDLKGMRRRGEQLSKGFDICIYMTNYRFFNSHARQTFAVLQIPYGPLAYSRIFTRVLGGEPKEAAKDFYRIQLLKRLRSTHAVLVYSKFVHDSLERIHQVPSTILEPAIDDFLSDEFRKERVILSVGRFFRGLYNDKRYDVLIDAFKQLSAELPDSTWRYRLVGSCGSDKASQKYLDELRRAAKGFPIEFHINSSYEDLLRHYNQATVFWHAAGFGVDESRFPQRAEHFGMSTLEAMSARCIPVVMNRGGQKEIVSHTESGYLWNNVDELLKHSMNLITDESLVVSLQKKVRARFHEFDRERFSNKLLSIIQFR